VPPYFIVLNDLELTCFGIMIDNLLFKKVFGNFVENGLAMDLCCENMVVVALIDINFYQRR